MKKTMLSPLLFDGRNLLNPDEIRGLGFTYISIGR
jgi:UDPglucose 6-dehydrogenase